MGQEMNGYAQGVIKTLTTNPAPDSRIKQVIDTFMYEMRFVEQ